MCYFAILHRIPAPVCTELKGDAPPEDCGGPGGFSELIRILQDPKDPQYKDMVEWNGGGRVGRAYTDGKELGRAERQRETARGSDDGFNPKLILFSIIEILTA